MQEEKQIDFDFNEILNQFRSGKRLTGTNLQMGFFPYVVYNFLKLLIGSPRNHF